MIHIYSQYNIIIDVVFNVGIHIGVSKQSELTPCIQQFETKPKVSTHLKARGCRVPSEVAIIASVVIKLSSRHL